MNEIQGIQDIKITEYIDEKETQYELKITRIAAAVFTLLAIALVTIGFLSLYKWAIGLGIICGVAAVITFLNGEENRDDIEQDIKAIQKIIPKKVKKSVEEKTYNAYGSNFQTVKSTSGEPIKSEPRHFSGTGFCPICRRPLCLGHGGWGGSGGASSIGTSGWGR